MSTGGQAAAEHVRVRTSLTVRRWDEDQARWTARRLGLACAPGLAITPGQFAEAGTRPYSTTRDDDCNLITQAGWTAVLGGTAGTTMTNKFSAANGRIGIGTSSTAATYTDTQLGGDTGSASTTSYYQMVSGAPVISVATTPPTLTFQATFAGTVANMAWNEFGTDNYTASGVTTQGLGAGYLLFNHGISAQGTKASGEIWTATEVISFGYAAVTSIS